MKFEPFVMERCLCRWENTVRLNISESGVHPLTFAELTDGADLGDTLLGYTQSNGTIPLRERIAALYPGSNVDQILVTTGTAEANFLSALTTLSPGDEVVAMIPNYMQIIGACRSLGARVIPFHLVEENGWRPDLDALDAAVSDRTKMILVCNPNNPSGAVLTEPEMDRIVAAAERSGAWLLADEVYRGAELSGEECPTFWGRTDRILLNAGLSKAFGLPGLRVGWTVTTEEKATELWSHRDYSSLALSAMSDRLAQIALDKRPAILERTRSIIRRQLPMVSDWVASHEDHPVRLSCTPPVAGAIAAVRYHHPISSEDLIERLRIERSLLVVPAQHFELDGFLRIGFGAEPEVVTESLGHHQRHAGHGGRGNGGSSVGSGRRSSDRHAGRRPATTPPPPSQRLAGLRARAGLQTGTRAAGPATTPPPPSQTTETAWNAGLRPARAAPRAAHVATPPGQGGSRLDVEFKTGGGRYDLERRLQPARGPQARKPRRRTA